MLNEKRKQKRALGRDCTSCGKRHFYDRYLCNKCYRFLNPNPNCICKVCNREFYVTPSLIKNNHGQYCSRDCKIIGMGEKVFQKECEYCKKVFTYFEDKRFTRKYCSNKCCTESLKGREHQISEEGNKKRLVHIMKLNSRPRDNYNKESYRTPEFKEKCRKKRLSQTFLKQGTDIEIMMKTAFDSIGLKYEHPYNLDGKFICDFGFPEAKIIVECDGSYWHSLPRNKHYDKLKESYCIKHNWLLLRFNDLQIKSNPTHLAKIIQNEVELQLMRMA